MRTVTRSLFLAALCCFLHLPSIFAAPPAPVPQTGQTTSYTAGDDGATQRGVVWPNPRFTDNVNGTVTDNLTGLIWLKDPTCLGLQDWPTALNKANSLASPACGLSDGSKANDWHLPTIRELSSLINAFWSTPVAGDGHPFPNYQFNYFWSSTTNGSTTAGAYRASPSSISISSNLKSGTTSDPYYVWPVRVATVAAPAPVPKTGQTVSYGARDDGALKTGVAWPNPRFTDNLVNKVSNGTVTDNLTGLIWLKDPSCLNKQTWSSALSAVNVLASGACGLNDSSRAGDWFLPNSSELWSLLAFGIGTTLPTNPFTGLNSIYDYWSSTGQGTTAESLTIINTSLGAYRTTWANNNAWPVRPQPIVTPVTGSGYTITPNTPQYVSTNTQFTITPLAGCNLTRVSGTCGGTLAGTTFTTSMVTASCTVIPECTFPLNVTMAGNGAGIVTSTPVGILCPSGACSADFTKGSSVILHVFPDANSTFGGWSGECSGSADCTVQLDTAKSFTATFNSAAQDKVRVIGAATTSYETLFLAFAAAKSGEGIVARGVEFIEPAPVFVGTATTFKGGFNTNFDPASASGNFTTMKGTLTIVSGGSLTVEGLKITP